MNIMHQHATIISRHHNDALVEQRIKIYKRGIHFGY